MWVTEDKVAISTGESYHPPQSIWLLGALRSLLALGPPIPAGACRGWRPQGLNDFAHEMTGTDRREPRLVTDTHCGSATERLADRSFGAGQVGELLRAQLPRERPRVARGVSDVLGARDGDDPRVSRQ